MIHIFVINPVSFIWEGALEEIKAEIEACFTEEDAGNHFLHVSRYPRDATVIIRKHLLAIPKTETVRVYAVGGDGILFDCENGIMGAPNVELAVVPYGNSNDFVRAFGEDKISLFRDIQLQIHSPSIPVDIIHCGNRYAINTCSIGIEADALILVISAYRKIASKIRKFQRLNSLVYSLLYYPAAVKAMLNRRLLGQRYEITVDGEDMSGQYGSINIANGPCYGGDKCAVATAMPNDGILDAMFFICPNWLKAVKYIVPYLNGACLSLPKEHFIWKRIRKIEIRSEAPLLVQMDGEIFYDTSITAEVIPAGLRVVAPGGVGFCKRMDVNGPNG